MRANQTFANLFNLDFSDILGSSYQHLLDSSTCTQETCPIAHEQLTEGQPVTCVHEHNARIYEVQLTPVPEDKSSGTQDTVHAIHVLRDITQAKQAERELRRRNREQALLNRVTQTPGYILGCCRQAQSYWHSSPNCRNWSCAGSR